MQNIYLDSREFPHISQEFNMKISFKYSGTFKKKVATSESNLSHRSDKEFLKIWSKYAQDT